MELLAPKEKKYLNLATIIHYIIGCVFLPVAIYFAFRLIITPNGQLIDFAPYYASAWIARISPSDLFHRASYMELYNTLSAGAEAHYKNTFFVMMAPPTVAVLLYPLSFFSYEHALTIFILVDLIVCLGIARQTGQLATALQLDELTPFFKSCVFGTITAFLVIAKGQTNLFICLFFINFLLALHYKNQTKTAFWLALLLQIRPQLFIPVFLYMAGCRQWRTIAIILGFTLLFCLLCMCVLTGHVWQDYLQFLIQYSHSGDGKERFAASMINLRGIFYQLDFHFYLIPAVTFIAVCAWCFFWPFLCEQKTGLFSLSVLMPIIFFTSPHLMINDVILLLPVSVALSRLMGICGKMRWMLLCYIPVSYALGFGVLEWQLRIEMLLFCCIAIYLFWNEKHWRATTLLQATENTL